MANLAFSKCGRYLACLVGVKESDPEEKRYVLRLFKINPEVQEVTDIPHVPFDISTISTSGCTDTNLLAVGARTSLRLLMLDLEHLRIVFDMEPIGSVGVTATCFGLDAKSVLCGLEDGRLVELSVADNEKSPCFFEDRHKAPITEIVLLNDGRYVSGDGDGSVYVWTDGRATGKDLGVRGGWIQGLAAHGTKFAFGLFGSASAEGDQIILFGSDGQRKGLQGHTFSIQGLRFIEDGKTLVSMGADKQIKLWSCEPFEQRLAISESEIFNTFAVSPDESMMAAGTREGTILLYRAPKK